MTPTIWILIAVVAALLAMAITGLGRGGSGARTFVRDVWAWVRREPDPAGTGAGPGANRLVETADAQEGGIDDLFTFGEQPTYSYIEPTELAQPFARVTRRAVGGLRGRVHR